MCRAAVESGSIDTLRIAMTNASSPQPLSASNNPRLYVDAVRLRRFGVLDWLRESVLFAPLYDRQGVFDAIVRHGAGSRDETARQLARVLDSGGKPIGISVAAMVKMVSLGGEIFDRMVRCVDSDENETDFGAGKYRKVTREALRRGSLEMLDTLVERGFGCEGHSVLSDALRHGHMDLLEALIARGREWTLASSRSGFIEAARENRLDDLRACVDDHPGGQIVFGGSRGNAMCYAASSCGAVDALRFCLERTSRPLHVNICQDACAGGKLECLRVAVDAGAPLSSKCLEIAVENGHAGTARFLLLECFHLFPVKPDRGSLLSCAMKSSPTPVFRETLLLIHRMVPDSTYDTLKILLTACSPAQRLERLVVLVEALPDTRCSEEAIVLAAKVSDARSSANEIRFLNAWMSADDWKGVYPALLRAECSPGVKAFIEKTKCW